MAVKLQIAYQKRLGLPGYSSHSFGVTVETEVSGLSHIEETNRNLYALLQRSVDRELQSSGFVPEQATTNGQSNGSHQEPADNTDNEWNCSVKQRGFITNIVLDNQVDWQEVEALCKELFHRPLKALNRLEASVLIDELLTTYAKKPGRQRNGYAGSKAKSR